MGAPVGVAVAVLPWLVLARVVSTLLSILLERGAAASSNAADTEK
jgi:hypothetical protein